MAFSLSFLFSFVVSCLSFLAEALTRYTLYHLFVKVADPEEPLDNARRHFKILAIRTNVVLAGQAAVLGFQYHTESPSLWLSLSLFMLLWIYLTRMIFESQTAQDFKTLVSTAHPPLVAIVHTLPEIFQVMLIAWEVGRLGGVIGCLLLTVCFAFYITLALLAGLAGRDPDPPTSQPPLSV